MKDLKFKKKTEHRLMALFMSSSLALLQKKEVELFMEMLPPSIHRQVVHDVCVEALKGCPSLRTLFLEDEVGYQVQLLMKHPEEVIFNYGDRSNGIYFVVSGKVVLYGPSTKERSFKNTGFLGVGEYFGEVGELLDTRRTLSVQGSTYYSTFAFVSK